MPDTWSRPRSPVCGAFATHALASPAARSEAVDGAFLPDQSAGDCPRGGRLEVREIVLDGAESRARMQ